MKPGVFVVTTVHWPDDTRIRERLIRTLSEEFAVKYATKYPGPADRSGLEWVGLAGGRIRRNFAALRLALGTDWDVMVLHDPETIPMGLLVRLLRRKPVIFDVHEDFPSVAHTREWVPNRLRPVLSVLARWILSLAERFLILTLAEPGYGRSFTRDHPVFPNYPDTSSYPPVQSKRRDEVVYLGDATLARGVDLAIEACRRAGFPLRLIGRVSTEIGRNVSPAAPGVFEEGVLPNPEAVRRVSEAAVGVIPLRDLPNYRHSQPTKLLEYLALGLPVVASDLPGTRDIAKDLEAAILVPPGDVAALAEAIKKAMTPEVRDLAITQSSMIRERFRWPADEVLSFYSNLL